MRLTYAVFFDKISSVMDFIGEKSAFLITDRVTRRYFVGKDVAEGILLLSRNSVFFTDARYFFAAKNLMPDNIDCRLYTNLDDVFSEIKRQGVSTLYIDYDVTTVAEYKKYQSYGEELKDGGKVLREKRIVKTAEEIKEIRRACVIIEKAYAYAVTRVKEGMSEKRLKDILERKAISLGASEMSFDTIVAFGENSAVPHHVTGETRLKPNQPVLIDCGCKVNGYCSDLTRTAFFGTPTEKFLSVYSAVKAANEKAEKEIYAGIPLKEADGVARDYLKNLGYGELFTHSLGHGVGLEIHEEPYLSPKAAGDLPVGAVFTVEPGVYINGEFGVRIEDTVLMTENGAERLFSDDKNLIIL